MSAPSAAVTGLLVRTYWSGCKPIEVCKTKVLRQIEGCLAYTRWGTLLLALVGEVWIGLFFAQAPECRRPCGFPPYGCPEKKHTLDHAVYHVLYHPSTYGAATIVLLRIMGCNTHAAAEHPNLQLGGVSTKGTLTAEWVFQDFHLSAFHSSSTWSMHDAGAGETLYCCVLYCCATLVRMLHEECVVYSI